MATYLEQKLIRFWQQAHTQYWLLAGITLLAIGLRFFRLGAWSFWIDEIFTINRSRNVVGFVTSWPPILPPISVILTHYVTALLGTTEWTARLVSNLIGIVSIPLLYFPVRRLFSAGIGLTTALLLAVSPWHLFWSQNARFYTSLLFLYSLTYFAIFVGFEENRLRLLLLAVPLLFLTMGERLTGLFVIPVAATYLIARHFGPFAGGRRLSWIGLMPVGLLLLAIIVYDGYRYVTVDYSLIITSFEIFIGKQIDDPFRLLVFITFNLSVPVMVLAVFGALHVLRLRDTAGLYVTLGAAVPLVLSVAISPFVFVKDRYVFISLLSWLILVAVAIDALWQMLPDRSKLLAVGVLCIVLAEGLWQNMQYYTINNGHRRDWRGAFALVEQRRGSADVVASSRAQLGEYYLGDEVAWMGDVKPGEVSGSGQVHWFVADSESVWVTGPIWAWVRANGELIDKRMLRIPEDTTLWIYRFEP